MRCIYIKRKFLFIVSAIAFTILWSSLLPGYAKSIKDKVQDQSNIIETDESITVKENITVTENEEITIDKPTVIIGDLTISETGKITINKDASLTLNSSDTGIDDGGNGQNTTFAINNNGIIDILWEDKNGFRGDTGLFICNDYTLTKPGVVQLIPATETEAGDNTFPITYKDTSVDEKLGLKNKYLLKSYKQNGNETIVSSDNMPILNASEDVYQLNLQSISSTQGDTGNNQQFQTFTAIASVKVAKAILPYTGSTRLTAEYGQTLNEISSQLPEEFAFTDPGDTPVGSPGENSFDINYKNQSSYDDGGKNPSNYEPMSITVDVKNETQTFEGEKTISSGNYHNLTVKKGSKITITGNVNVYGSLVVENGAELYIMGSGRLVQIYEARKPENKTFKNDGLICIDGTGKALLGIPGKDIQASGNGKVKFVNSDKGRFKAVFGKTVKGIVPSAYCKADKDGLLNAGEYKSYSVNYVPENGYRSFAATVDITVSKASLPYSGASSLTAIHGQRLGDLKGKLPAGYAFVNDDSTLVGNVGNRTFAINYRVQTTYSDPRNNPSNYNNHSLTIVVVMSEGEKLSVELSGLNVTRANLNMTIINNVNSLDKRYGKLPVSEKNKVSKSSFNKLAGAKNVIKSCNLKGNVYYRFSNGTLTVFGKGRLNDLFSKFDIKKGAKQVKKRKFQKQYASGIKTVKVENGVTYIGNGYFAYLPKLASVQFKGKKGTIVLGKCVFFKCPKLNKLQMDGVKVIGFACFGQCTGLKNVKISEGLTLLNKSAFAFCKSLIKAEFPSTLNNISYTCFDNCIHLQTIILGGAIKSCGNYAFYETGKKVAKSKRIIYYKKKPCAKLIKQAKSAGYTLKKK